jgi:TolB protein
LAGDELQNLLKSGIQAARSGEKAVARGIFEQVLRLDSQNELAWLWMASVLDSPAERQKALQRVLSINPNNEKAQQALAKLLGGKAPATASPTLSVESARPAPISATPPAARADEPKLTTAELQLISPEAIAARTAIIQHREAIRQQNTFFYVIGGVIVFLLLAAALALAYVQLLDEESANSTATPVNQIPVVQATSIPPTRTPVAISTIPAGQLAGLSQDLPPTWTAMPSPTGLPSATPTEPASDPASWQLVFSGQENPAALTQLWLLQADGSSLEALAIRVEAPILPSPTPQEVAPDATVSAEATDEVLVEGGDFVAEGDAGPGASISDAFSDFEFTDPAFSPDGQWIAFTLQTGPATQELYLYNVQTKRLRPLTNLEASITDGAVWSPDGTQIAFSSNDSPDGSSENIFNIYLVNIETDIVENFTDNPSQNRQPSWSPDGQTIVFASDRGTPGELELWSQSFINPAAVQLTDDVNSSFAPSFSHDGSQILFISDRSGDSDLYIMQADGTGETLLSVDDLDAEDRDPAFSPDGDWIIVSSNRDESRVLQLWRVSADGGTWQVITQSLGENRHAQWRPQTQ